MANLKAEHPSVEGFVVWVSEHSADPLLARGLAFGTPARPWVSRLESGPWRTLGHLGTLGFFGTTGLSLLTLALFTLILFPG